jgi:hypothetical protein
MQAVLPSQKSPAWQQLTRAVLLVALRCSTPYHVAFATFFYI